ncbi:MAG: PotD/PotF family extracellular solute-binding protein [Variibacter sp.]
MNGDRKITRRGILRAAAFSLAAPALLRSTDEAVAQEAELVVGNWGGDWSQRFERFHERQFQAKNSVKLVYEYAGGPARVAKLVAQQNLPRGTMDVAHLTDANAYELNVKGILEPLDMSLLPNFRHMYPQYQTPYYVRSALTAFIILYNPEKVTQPPTTFMDLWDPRWADRVGIIEQNFYHYIIATALTEGGTPSKLDAAFPKMLELSKSVRPRIYPTLETVKGAFKNEEVWIMGCYLNRGLQWQRDGMTVGFAYPKEGPIVNAFGAAIPKRARNKKLAHAYLNDMLDPKVQGDFCADAFCAPTIDNAIIAPDVREKIDIPAAHRSNVNLIDDAYLAANQAKWLEWWNKDFKRV